MARTVASLVVSINASTKGLRRGLKNAKKMVANFASSVARAIAGVAKLGAGLTLLAGGVAAIGTGKAINSLSSLADTAKKLNIRPTMLVALRDAAKESGVDVGQLDARLETMLRRIQDAARGKGPAVGVLKELGLNAHTLKSLAPEKQLLAVARAMGRMKGDGLDLARMTDLFDASGRDLINTLELLNKKGIEPFIAAATRSGRAGVSLEVGLPNVERVTEAMTRLKDRVTGIFTQMALAVAVPLDNLLKRFESFLNSGSAMSELFRDMRKAGFQASWAIDNFFANRGKAGEFRVEIERLWEKFKEFMSWVSQHLTAENLSRAFDAVVSSAKSAIEAVQDLIKMYKELRDFLPNIKAKAVDVVSDRMLEISNTVKFGQNLWKQTGFSEDAVLNSMKAAARTEGATPKVGSEEEKRQTKILERQTELLERISRERHERLMILG